MHRHPLTWFIPILLVLGAASACSAPTGVAESTAPARTPQSRPTLPPTWTPSVTPLSIPTRRPTITLTPTDTPTLTPTLPPLPSVTRRPPPSPTPTWTLVLSGSPTPEVVAGTPALPGEAAPAGQGCTGEAASDNLLVNGDFEEGQSPYLGNDAIQAPNGWDAFWRAFEPVLHDPENQDGYLAPGMRVVQNIAPFDDPPRIYSGFQALLMYGPNRVIDGGVWQQVRAGSGRYVCLTGYGHAWSSIGEDPLQSTLNSGDDRRNANFLLGVDPLGGVDPDDERVVWGEVAHIYDSYQAIPSVQARAINETVTVFVRGYSLWRFPHNDFYFDQISLVLVTLP